MTSATVSRLVKEELLNSAYPEYYPSRVIRRVAPKQERKIKIDPTIKIETVDRKRRAAKPLNYDTEVEFVRSFAPRRPYQWKGRKVQRVLRPGTVVQFTPGVRTSSVSKRSYDEVFSDLDILDQAEQRIGEFAYGKRPKIEAVALDTNNSTPSLKPVTPQMPIKLASKRSMVGDLQPTVQVMVPTKKRKTIPLQNVKIEPENIVMEEVISTPNIVDIKPPIATQPVLTIPAVSTTAIQTPMEVEDIKIRPIKQVTSDIGIQTVDVQVPISNSISSTSYIPKRVQGLRYHPSIIIGPKVVNKRRRRKRTVKRVWRAPSKTSTGSLLPKVIYHPSIN